MYRFYKMDTGKVKGFPQTKVYIFKILKMHYALYKCIDRSIFEWRDNMGMLSIVCDAVRWSRKRHFPFI